MLKKTSVDNNNGREWRGVRNTLLTSEPVGLHIRLTTVFFALLFFALIAGTTFALLSITITVPANTTINKNYTDLNWSSNETVSWAGYELDGAANVTTALWCYQESANVTNQTGLDNCGGLKYTGSYASSNYTIDINYTMPLGALNTSLWQIKTGTQTGSLGITISNLSIPSDGWKNPLQLRIYSNVSTNASFAINRSQQLLYYNGSSWNTLRSIHYDPFTSDGGCSFVSRNNSALQAFDGDWNSGVLYGENLINPQNNQWQWGSCEGQRVGDVYEEAMWWNVSQPATVTLSSLSDGSHTVKVFANDSSGNMNSASVGFSVDTTPPNTPTQSPTNTTLNKNFTNLNWTTNEPLSSASYELDGAGNISVGFSGMCYQESANILNQTGLDNCGGLNYTGIASASSNVPKDGNWSNAWGTGTTATLLVNYSKPIGALNTSLWQVKDLSGTANLSIPASCWALSPLQFRGVIDDNVVTTNWTCYDGSGYVQVRFDSTHDQIFEEAMWWNISYSINTTLTGLSDGLHKLNLYATDIVGNINKTQVNFSVDTTPPGIVINNPTNQTYGINNISLSYTLSNAGDLDKIWRILNATANVTITGNITFLADEGWNNLTVFANDTRGNIGSSSTIFFSVLTSSPSPVILSPLNQTYNTKNISLLFVVQNGTALDKTWYRLNATTNITITGNITFLADNGQSNITVFTNNTLGAISQNVVYFSVDTLPKFVRVTANLTSTSYLTLKIDFTDPSIDYTPDSCFFGNIKNKTLNGVCNLTVPLIGADYLWINDSINQNISRFVNFTYKIGNEFQSLSNQSVAGGNAYTSFLFNSSSSVNLTYFTFCRSGWTQNVTNTTLNFTSNLIGCNNSAILSNATQSVIDSLFILVNYLTNGHVSVNVTNADTLLNYSNVYVDITPNVMATWRNLSNTIFNVSVANGSLTNVNRSMSINSSYKTSFETTFVISSAGGVTNYKCEVAFYVTSNFTNTSQFNILFDRTLCVNYVSDPANGIAIDGTTITDPSIAFLDTTSMSYLSYDVLTSTVNNTINSGSHTADVFYTVTTGVGSGITGGGGGGGGGQTQSCSDFDVYPYASYRSPTTSKVPVEITDTISAGNSKSYDLGIENLGNVNFVPLFQVIPINDTVLTGQMNLPEAWVGVQKDWSSLDAGLSKKMSVTVTVPSDAAPGTYVGKFNVNCNGFSDSARLTITVLPHGQTSAGFNLDPFTLAIIGILVVGGIVMLPRK